MYCISATRILFLVLLWGPLFVGAPVRPNMLNMPKSAAGHVVQWRRTVRRRQSAPSIGSFCRRRRQLRTSRYCWRRRMVAVTRHGSMRSAVTTRGRQCPERRGTWATSACWFRRWRSSPPQSCSPERRECQGKTRQPDRRRRRRRVIG